MVATARAQKVTSPADVDKLQQRPLSGQLSELELQAVNFIRSFAWSGELLALYEGYQEPGIIGVFLVHLLPVAVGVDEWLWIVVGDLPPAYLIADGNPTWQRAIAGYIDEMQRWVDAAKTGAPVDDLIPVNTPPTTEYAAMLESRLRTLSETLLDPSRTLLKFRLHQAAEVEEIWALRQEDGTFEIESIPFHTCEAAVGDIVKAQEVDGDFFFIERVKRSGNSVIRVQVQNSDELANLRTELHALGCDSEVDGAALAVNVPAEVSYAPIAQLLNEGERARRWKFEEAILGHEREAEPDKRTLRPSAGRPHRKTGQT
jgi:hypothetical protein